MARMKVANVGDHALIREFLLKTGTSAVETDFSHWLDDPTYEPSDRLLVRLGDQIIGHVHVVRRIMLWGGERVSTAGLQDLAVLPEYEGSDCRRQLLLAATAQAKDDGALVATTRGNCSLILQELDWILCTGHAMTQASARDVLAYLTPIETSGRHRMASRVRPWRRIEMQEVMSIYRAATKYRYGTLWRSEPYWHWLLGRNLHDQILVAERPTEPGRPAVVVGYAMIRRDHVIGLATLPGYEEATAALLLHACRDVIERGFQTITVYLPCDDQTHDMMLTAGGRYIPGVDTPTGELLLQLLDGDGWVRGLSTLWQRRASVAKLSRPCEIVFDTDRQRIRFTLSRRGGRLTDAKDASPDVSCSRVDFNRLLVGQLLLQEAIDDQRIRVFSDYAETILRALFHYTLAWQSPLDSRAWY